jgi:hypothetical protein
MPLTTDFLVLRLHGGGYPQYILTGASYLNDDNEPIRNKFFSLYNMILNYWFPSADYYTVYPKWSIPNSESTEDSSIDFVIEYQHRPLLLVEIHAPLDLQFDSGRRIAVSQVIVHLDEIGPTNQHADRLYAITAFGKMWRACYALRGSGGEGGQPVKGIAAKTSLLSVSPECWNPDITSEESWVALQGIVEIIKGYVTQQSGFSCNSCYMFSHKATSS